MERLIIAFCLLFLSAPVHALTLKKGQVIGGDGAVYDGASPEQQSQLIKTLKKKTFLGIRNLQVSLVAIYLLSLKMRLSSFHLPRYLEKARLTLLKL